jgi:hypothetical protein
MGIDDCHSFLSAPERWAERAARLGWDAIALFGCAPTRPLDYSASAGLLWAMNGGRLVELHRDWAVIDMPLQTRQRVFYRRNVERTEISLAFRVSRQFSDAFHSLFSSLCFLGGTRMKRMDKGANSRNPLDKVSGADRKEARLRAQRCGGATFGSRQQSILPFALSGERVE